MRGPLLSCALVVSVIACGGRTSNDGNSPNAPVETSDGGTSLDATPLSDGSTTLDGGTDVYCRAMARYRQRCGFVTDCDVAYLAWCDGFAPILSESFKQVLAACIDGVSTCNSRSADHVESSKCVASGMDALAPTATQHDVAVKYCAYCPGAVDDATCVKQFFHGPQNGTSYSSGWGDVLLQYSDGVTSAVASTCFTSDGGHDAVCAQFSSCILDVARHVPRGGPMPRCDDGG
jgi:hypothetical protein